MWIGSNCTPGSKPGINDISELTQCKLLLPFTGDLLDHSIYNWQLKNNGMTLSDSGAVSSGDAKYIDLSVLRELSLGLNFTIETIITLNSYPNDKANVILSSSDSSYNNRIVFYASGSKIKWFYNYGTEYDTLTSNDDFPLNIPTHIAIVRKNGFIKMYVNGEEQNTPTNPSPIDFGYKLGIVIKLGSYVAQNSNWYTNLNGVIGGFRITLSALNPSEFAMTRPFFIPQINFKQGNKIYLYKDGILDPRIILPPGITNNGDYLVNSGGNVVLNFNIPEIIGKKLMLKTYATGSAATNKYFLIWQIGATNAYLKEYFDAESSVNRMGFLGYDYSGLEKSYSQRISFTGAANQLRIYEMWYE